MVHCNNCNTDKPESEFHFKIKEENVLDDCCKDCREVKNKTTNNNRMYVNGKYIPSTHPLYKPGRYKALDDAWSHEKIESTKEGEVYAIINDAWPEWVKIGKAVSTADRLNGYQTSSPFRDYKIAYYIETPNRHKSERALHKLIEGVADERIGEWFKVDVKEVKYIFDIYYEGQKDEFATAS